MNKGMVQVYTGTGKGKTTAAAGLAVRALSRGLKVLFVQIMKPANSGETELLDRIGVRVLRFKEADPSLFNPDADRDELARAATGALRTIKDSLEGFDLAILDEFNHLLAEGLIERTEAEDLIKGRPDGLELVITCRAAPEWLIESADLVTEMNSIKHSHSGG